MPDKDYYAQHRARYIEQAQARHRMARKMMDEAKQNPCAKCSGTFHPCAMDFHHRDGTKEIGVSKMHTMSLTRLAEEIIKCDVICSNCHRELHFADRTGYAYQADA